MIQPTGPGTNMPSDDDEDHNPNMSSNQNALPVLRKIKTEPNLVEEKPMVKHIKSEVEDNIKPNKTLKKTLPASGKIEQELNSAEQKRSATSCTVISDDETVRSTELYAKLQNLSPPNCQLAGKNLMQFFNSLNLVQPLIPQHYVPVIPTPQLVLSLPTIVDPFPSIGTNVDQAQNTPNSAFLVQNMSLNIKSEAEEQSMEPVHPPVKRTKNDNQKSAQTLPSHGVLPNIKTESQEDHNQIESIQAAEAATMNEHEKATTHASNKTQQTSTDEDEYEDVWTVCDSVPRIRTDLQARNKYRSAFRVVARRIIHRPVAQMNCGNVQSTCTTTTVAPDNLLSKIRFELQRENKYKSVFTVVARRAVHRPVAQMNCGNVQSACSSSTVAPDDLLSKIRFELQGENKQKSAFTVVARGTAPWPVAENNCEDVQSVCTPTTVVPHVPLPEIRTEPEISDKQPIQSPQTTETVSSTENLQILPEPPREKISKDSTTGSSDDYGDNIPTPPTINYPVRKTVLRRTHSTEPGLEPGLSHLIKELGTHPIVSFAFLEDELYPKHLKRQIWGDVLPNSTPVDMEVTQKRILMKMENTTTEHIKEIESIHLLRLAAYLTEDGVKTISIFLQTKEHTEGSTETMNGSEAFEKVTEYVNKFVIERLHIQFMNCNSQEYVEELVSLGKQSLRVVHVEFWAFHRTTTCFSMNDSGVLKNLLNNCHPFYLKKLTINSQKDWFCMKNKQWIKGDLWDNLEYFETTELLGFPVRDFSHMKNVKGKVHEMKMIDLDFFIETYRFNAHLNSSFDFYILNGV
ncbi:hypothetical protein CAEBREN_24897 [Caenorhabditis brenneri]|uniref:Uncharacterized protein n=1 Tax=Caenorhabditis brenneri TaxID=135651 RepID=G0P8L9_CAEBE|nr:hypothetical protein CAEBREN_24897 [Caenorhabditis brenneri]